MEAIITHPIALECYKKTAVVLLYLFSGFADFEMLNSAVTVCKDFVERFCVSMLALVDALQNKNQDFLAFMSSCEWIKFLCVTNVLLVCYVVYLNLKLRSMNSKKSLTVSIGIGSVYTTADACIGTESVPDENLNNSAGDSSLLSCPCPVDDPRVSQGTQTDTPSIADPVVTPDLFSVDEDIDDERFHLPLPKPLPYNISMHNIMPVTPQESEAQRPKSILKKHGAVSARTRTRLPRPPPGLEHGFYFNKRTFDRPGVPDGPNLLCGGVKIVTHVNPFVERPRCLRFNFSKNTYKEYRIGYSVGEDNLGYLNKVDNKRFDFSGQYKKNTTVSYNEWELPRTTCEV